MFFRLNLKGKFNLKNVIVVSIFQINIRMIIIFICLFLFNLSTYNKQWNEAHIQISDLLQFESPKGEPKPENVIYLKLIL